jgi:hypothetical protein
VQTPGPLTAPAHEEATRLEDVTVTGGRLETLIESFVREVAAPNPGRNLARWDTTVCVAVMNFQTEGAQYLADRISTIASDVGLNVGRPGCTPNVVVIGSSHPGTLARELVDNRPKMFRLGGPGMDQGGAALRRFHDNDAAVRWWQIAMPTDEQTGERAYRIPGDCRNSCQTVFDMAPAQSAVFSSRLKSQVVDNLIRAIVIVDTDKVSHLSALQLADYIAMVTLSQVDPEADPTSYASILNVINNPASADSLTDWDTSYLAGLYKGQRGLRGLGSGRSEVVSSIRRSHADMASQRED